MKEKVVTLLVGIIELLTIKSWMVCHNLRSMMDLSSVNTKLQLEDYIHNDTGSSFFIIRLFHNKVIGLLINILDKYLKYWDIRFTSNVFSLVGVFGIPLGLWQIGVSKVTIWMKLGIFGVLLLWPLPFALHMVQLPFLYGFSLFVLPYYLVSLFGIWKFLQNNKYSYIPVILLSLLSIWWFLLLPHEIDYFCSK